MVGVVVCCGWFLLFRGWKFTWGLFDFRLVSMEMETLVFKSESGRVKLICPKDVSCIIVSK